MDKEIVDTLKFIVDNMATKDDLKTMATKDDVKAMETRINVK